jgi:hypothetical protein
MRAKSMAVFLQGIKKALLLLIGLLLLGWLLIWAMMIRMPAKSFTGSLPPLTAEEKSSSDRLQRHVAFLAGEIGERHFRKPMRLEAAADDIASAFRKIGYEVRSQEYRHDGQPFRNLEATLPGGKRAEEIVLVGAHYDSVIGSPGADDNATGVAALLELAEVLKTESPDRTIRFVAFTNEEGPISRVGEKGSRIYAREARRRGDQIVAMISIESIGYYASEPGSQHYPFPLTFFYPDRGDFIAFVGNLQDGKLVRRSIAAFRRNALFPSEGIAAPSWIPGVSWSDHDSFWREAYPAIMVTDTVPFRNPHYHRSTDKPETIDYFRLARVVHGLTDVVRSLAKGDPSIESAHSD